jgi:hypothetical protein
LRRKEEGAGDTTSYTPEETQRRFSGRHYMLYPRGDVKKKEREAIHAIDPRKLKDDGLGSSTCYSPEER